VAKHMLPMTILLVASAPGLAQAPAPVSKATFIQRIDRDFAVACHPREVDHTVRSNGR